MGEPLRERQTFVPGLHVAVEYLHLPQFRERADHPGEGPVPLHLLGVVGAGEAEGVASFVRFDGIVDGGLGRERQKINAAALHPLPVFGDLVHVRREDHVEKLRRADEGLEMLGVLLVPEDRGDAVPSAVDDQLDQLRADDGHLPAPGFVQAFPGRFHQQEMGLELLDLGLPVGGAQREHLAFEREG